MILSSIADTLTHIIWPRSCPVCGRPAVAFCPDCVDSAIAPLPPFCAKCGSLFGTSCCGGSVPCYAAAVHDGAARCLVIDFKYRGNRAIGRAIGEKIAALFDPPAADAVAAVPLHKGSERPYNQSDIIARYAARCWGLPHIPEALCWTKATGPQMGRNSIMRKSLPNGAIAAKKPLAGLKVVLVDDVYTTGATMRAAIEGAESAGCRVAAAYVWTKRVSRSENPLSWQGAEVSL